MVDNKFETLREFFHSVGLLASSYRFDKIVPSNTTRALLQKNPNDAAKILIHSPDLFVMPGSMRGEPKEREKTAIAQTFFVKLLNENYAMSVEEYKIYKKYYPSRAFVLASFEGEQLRLFNMHVTKPVIKGKTAIFKIPKTALVEHFLESIGIDKDVIAAEETEH